MCQGHWHQHAKGKPLTPFRHYRRGGVCNSQSIQDLAEWILSISIKEPSGCIKWTRGCTRSGYGHLRYKGGTVYAHRIVLEATSGAPLPGMEARHSCDNPNCVNPDHLTWGSSSDNKRDFHKRGRRHCKLKLTEEQVSVIKSELAAGTDVPVLAEEYGVHQATISDIKSGRHWGWVK